MAYRKPSRLPLGIVTLSSNASFLKPMFKLWLPSMWNWSNRFAYGIMGVKWKNMPWVSRIFNSTSLNMILVPSFSTEGLLFGFRPLDKNSLMLQRNGHLNSKHWSFFVHLIYAVSIIWNERKLSTRATFIIFVGCLLFTISFSSVGRFGFTDQGCFCDEVHCSVSNFGAALVVNCIESLSWRGVDLPPSPWSLDGGSVLHQLPWGSDSSSRLGSMLEDESSSHFGQFCLSLLLCFGCLFEDCCSAVFISANINLGVP